MQGASRVLQTEASMTLDRALGSRTSDADASPSRDKAIPPLGSDGKFIHGWDAVDFLVSLPQDAIRKVHAFSTTTAAGSAFCKISAVNDRFDETVIGRVERFDWRATA